MDTTHTFEEKGVGGTENHKCHISMSSSYGRGGINRIFAKIFTKTRRIFAKTRASRAILITLRRSTPAASDVVKVEEVPWHGRARGNIHIHTRRVSRIALPDISVKQC